MTKRGPMKVNGSHTDPPPPAPDNRSAAAPARGIGARRAALRVLTDLREGRRTARETIDELTGQLSLPPREVALASELVMGVVRHRLTLAKVLGAYAVHGWQKVGRELQHILMIGGYQLIWLDSVPAFAAVNEAVDQGRAVGGTKAARFVNAILRQLLRDIEHRRIDMGETEPTQTIPIDEQQGLQLRRAVLTDPAVNPTAYLAEATSHPTWLVGRWIRQFGRAQAEAVCRAGMRRPTLMLRPNRLRIDAAGLVSRLRADGFEAEALPGGGVVMTGETAGLMHGGAFTSGLFQAQDPAAMRAVQRMKLTAGQTVIDLCAGVGTKTTQMAEALSNEGTILATDKDRARLERLRSNCARLGLNCVETVEIEQIREAAGGLSRLDWILVDAPCSNTGVLSRRPEARYRVDDRSLRGLAAIQAEVLDLAAALARPETRILYSTCSLEPEENEQVAVAFAGRHPGWSLTESELTLPNGDAPPTGRHDGGYWSAWRQAK